VHPRQLSVCIDSDHRVAVQPLFALSHRTRPYSLIMIIIIIIIIMKKNKKRSEETSTLELETVTAFTYRPDPVW